MSRSYRHKDYFSLVCLKDSNKQHIKRITNRAFRRRLNRGEFDSFSGVSNVHRKTMDLAYTYDMFCLYMPEPHWGTHEAYSKAKRK